MLEAELIEAVIGDRQAQQECEPARDRCALPSHEDAAPTGRRPYIHSAENSWKTANRTAIVVSHTFIVIVLVKPAVDREIRGR